MGLILRSGAEGDASRRMVSSQPCQCPTRIGARTSEMGSQKIISACCMCRGGGRVALRTVSHCRCGLRYLNPQSGLSSSADLVVYAYQVVCLLTRFCNQKPN